MKNIFKNILIGILAIIICILIFKIYNFNKNYKLMYAIDEANLLYVGSGKDYHINIKETICSPEGVTTTNTVDIYKKGCNAKRIYSDSDIIHYEKTGSFESFNISNNDNKVTSDSRSYTDEFTHFLETYYRHLSKSKITKDDNNYILTIENCKYYFDKENYRIMKTELYGANDSNTYVAMECIYTYYDDEEIEEIEIPEF